MTASTPPLPMRSAFSCALATIAVLLTLAGTVLTGKAEAGTPIISYSMTPSTTQAGAHPDIATQFRILPGISQEPTPCHCNTVKEIIINTPPGLVAAPINTPRCTQSQFAILRCPPDSQIGVVLTGIGVEPGDGGGSTFQPLYNMVPRPNQLALWGTFTPFIALPSIFTAISVRTEDDYGIELKTFGIPGIGTPPEFVIMTWGVPADSKHDVLRFPHDIPETRDYTVICQPEFGSPVPELMASEYPAVKCSSGNPFHPANVDPVPANNAAVPYFSNPTACGGLLQTTIETISYDTEIDEDESPYLGITGCDQLSFNPSLTAKPTTLGSDSPSGLDIRLSVPQTLSPTTPSPSQIRTSRVTLPEGFTINPSAADGKTSCSDSEAKFGTREEARCPEISKVGTLSITSSALPGTLPGNIYLGEPLPGNRYRVILTADGFSLHIKLPGTARPDPKTGRLTISFEDLPQAPFEEFDLHVFGAERGLLATPTQCGTYAVDSEFVPWAADLPTQTSRQFFTLDTGPNGSSCPPAMRPFSPRLTAGVTDNTAGSHTDFVFDLKRDDGDQNLSAIDVDTPPGFTAVLAGIPYCPDAVLTALAQSSYLGMSEQATPACPTSRVGTSTTAAGSGSRPVSLPGRVYLAGPYNGAPVSLAVVTPAVSGPYDLGNVVVRVALHVNPITAQVTAVSDDLPQILEGVPLRLRNVLIALDRDRFVLNPTNCDPLSIGAQVTGDQGALSTLASNFQVGNCGSLPYSPRLSLRLTGGVERRGHPAIHAVVTMKPGEANSRRISVTLPKGSLLDNSHIGTVCTRVAFARDACPPGSMIGHAAVKTPLLDQPLKGAVYLRSSEHELPDMVLNLEGQFDVEAAGRIDSVKARLRTTFETVPDVPVSRIKLDLMGGSKGLLQNSESLCGKSKTATTRMVGQNGVRFNTRTKLSVDCGKSRRKAG